MLTRKKESAADGIDYAAKAEKEAEEKNKLEKRKERKKIKDEQLERESKDSYLNIE